MKILLASSSPYRRQLLDRLNITYSHSSPRVDESQLKQRYEGALDQLPQHLAESKARSLMEDNPNGLTIGCDQMAILGKEALDKPSTIEEAQQQLEKLRGNTHHLITALSVHCQGLWLHDTNITSLTMKKLTDEQILSYIQQDQPLGCAGSYKIEGLGIALFEEIKTDDFTAIIGLPLIGLCRILEKFKCSVLTKAQ